MSKKVPVQNSDGLDVGALQEYGFTSPVNERANAVKLILILPMKFPNDKESRVTMAQGRLQGLALIKSY